MDYTDIYPRETLERARRILIESLNSSEVYALEKVKPKIGINSRFGSKILPPPLPPEYSHLGIGFEKSSDEYMRSRKPLNIEHYAAFPPHFNDSYGSVFSTDSNNRNFNNDSSSLFMNDHYQPHINMGFNNEMVPLMNQHSRQDGSFHGSRAGNFAMNFMAHENNTYFEGGRSSWRDEGSSNSYTNFSPENNQNRSLSPVETSPVFYSGMSKNSNSTKTATISRPPSSSESFESSISAQYPGPTPVKRRYSDEAVSSSATSDFIGKKLKLETDKTEITDTQQNSRSQRETSQTFDHSPLKMLVIKGNANNCTRIGTLILIYKCDFCRSAYYELSGLKEHLKLSQHFSGSLYNAKPNEHEPGVQLLSIKKILVTKYKHSKLNSLVVICPDCEDVFEDIFMCSLHSKYTHNILNGCYSICPVISHQTVMVHTVPKCSECGSHFESHVRLHRHWTEQNHLPVVFENKGKTNTIKLIICPYCKKNFRGNFINSKMHALTHKEVGNNSSVGLEVKEVILPRQRFELPPLDTSDKNGLQIELDILQNMIKHFSTFSETKTKIQNIKHRIAFIKNQLGLVRSP